MVIEKPFCKSADFKLSKIILICNSNLVFYNFFSPTFAKHQKRKAAFCSGAFFNGGKRNGREESHRRME